MIPEVGSGGECLVRLVRLREREVPNSPAVP